MNQRRILALVTLAVLQGAPLAAKDAAAPPPAEKPSLPATKPPSKATPGQPSPGAQAGDKASAPAPGPPAGKVQPRLPAGMEAAPSKVIRPEVPVGRELEARPAPVAPDAPPGPLRKVAPALPGGASPSGFEAPVSPRPTMGGAPAGGLGGAPGPSDLRDRRPAGFAPSVPDPGPDLAIVSASVVEEGAERGRIRFVVKDLNRSRATPLGQPIPFTVGYEHGGELTRGTFTLSRPAGEAPLAEVTSLAQVLEATTGTSRRYRIRIDPEHAIADVRRSNNSVIQRLGLGRPAGSSAAQPGDGLLGAWVDSEGPGWLRLRLRYALTLVASDPREQGMFRFRFEDVVAGRFRSEIGCTNGKALWDDLGRQETVYLCMFERGPGPLETSRIHVTMQSTRVSGLAEQELILDHRKTWTRGGPDEGGRPPLPDLAPAMRGFTQGPNGLGAEALFAVRNVGDGLALDSTVVIEFFFVEGPVFRQRLRVEQLRPGEEQLFNVRAPDHHPSGVEARLRASGLVARILVDEQEELMELDEVVPNQGEGNLLQFRL